MNSMLFLPALAFGLASIAFWSNNSLAQTLAASVTPADQNRWLQLENTIPEMLDSAEVQGMSLAVIETGQLAWVRGFGVKNAETKAPVTEATIFQAASLSKPVFAFAVFKLVEQGRFNLDKPLLEYVPQPYFEEAFLKRPLDDARLRQLTARMVLSHCTGFPNWRGEDKGLKLNFDPGVHFSYSGEGFVLLQRVIEYFTQQSLQEFVEQQVFVPLGMSASSYVWRESDAPELAAAHGSLGKVEDKAKMTEGNAAYSLYTTARDYGVFLAAILNQSGLGTGAVEQMLKPQIALPQRWGDLSGKKAEGLAWGLGWGLLHEKGKVAFWHWGDNGQFKCYVVGYSQQRRGLAFFTNSANGLALAEVLVRRVLGEDHAALLRWLDYDAYNSASSVFAKTARVQNVQAALAQYRQQKAVQADYQLREGAVNRLGYALMGLNRIDEALQVFQLNLDHFPDSWNVYDSYAEAQLRHGNRRLAEQYYQKSLDLNPGNNGAQHILAQLRAKPPRTGNVRFMLKGRAQARFVALAGSFNHWSDLHTLCDKEGEEWICQIDLKPGKYFYKFVVDGQWILDAENPNSEKDGNGNANSVLVVEH